LEVVLVPWSWTPRADSADLAASESLWEQPDISAGATPRLAARANDLRMDRMVQFSVVEAGVIPTR